MVPAPLFCTKRPLAGNLYCSPSPPLYVAEIWRKIHNVYTLDLDIGHIFRIFRCAAFDWSHCLESCVAVKACSGSWVSTPFGKLHFILHCWIHLDTACTWLALQQFKNDGSKLHAKNSPRKAWANQMDGPGATWDDMGTWKQSHCHQRRGFNSAK